MVEETAYEDTFRGEAFRLVYPLHCLILGSLTLGSPPLLANPLNSSRVLCASKYSSAENGGPAASPIWRLRRAAWARHPGRMRAAVSRDRWAPLGSPRAAELRWRNRNGCPSSAPAPGLPK